MNNTLEYEDNRISQDYREFLEKCCDLLDWNKEEVHNMKYRNFWLFGFLEDFRTPEEAVEVFKQKREEYGDDFPPKPEVLTLSARDSEQLLEHLENPPPMSEELKKSFRIYEGMFRK